jgi:hypothetical protein
VYAQLLQPTLDAPPMGGFPVRDLADDFGAPRIRFSLGKQPVNGLRLHLATPCLEEPADGFGLIRIVSHLSPCRTIRNPRHGNLYSDT